MKSAVTGLARTNREDVDKTCIDVKCNACEESRVKEFYVSRNPAHARTKKIPWCKTCIGNMYFDYVKKYGDAQYAMYYLCRKYDISYSNVAWFAAKKSVDNKGMDTSILGEYMRLVNSLGGKNSHGDCFEESKDTLDEIGEVKKTKKVKSTPEDKKAQDDVLRLLGYDPFAKYDAEDRIFLCNDLVNYLDEDTLEDAFKISVILQIVNNNNQIRKVDAAINLMSSGDMNEFVKNASNIKELTEIKAKLAAANDRLSKENSIALKHRAGAGTQNNTLGSMMKKLREMNFEKAEHDYYDMKKAFGIRQSADISNKSIVEILNLSDDNNINNMLKMQREELQKLQDAELDYKEQIRVLVTENNSLKNNVVESGE